MQADLDLEQLLAPIADGAPSGSDLRYDPDFDLLQTALTPAFDFPTLDGREVQVPRPREFTRIRREATALLKRGRDLRVLVGLIEALTATEGPAGLAAGLALLRGAIERHWETLHPALDPELSLPAERRLNAVRDLAAHDRLLSELRRVPLVAAPGLGALTYRDWELATGQAAPLAYERRPDAAVLDGVLRAAADGLGSGIAALATAERELGALGRLLAEKVGDPRAVPDLAPLETLIGKLKALLAAHAPAPAEPVSPASRVAPPPAALPIRLESREEVLRALDLAIDYYRRCEPGSPLPLLLERARRLVTMTFLEAMADLAPEAAKQIRGALGAKE